MDTPTLRAALGASTQAIKDVVRYGHLGISKGKQGSSRDWSRDEAVLIGYYLTACKVGVSPHEAARIAHFWAETKNDQEYDTWAFNFEEPFVHGTFPTGSPHGVSTSIESAFNSVALDGNIDEWSEAIAKPAPPLGIVVVNLSGIRSRIEAALNEKNP